MAETFRSVDFDIWDDPWILGLPPIARYLFIHLITCRESHVSGVFRISLPIIAFRTGLAAEVIAGYLKDFDATRKVLVFGDWIFIIAMQRRQVKGTLSGSWAKSILKHIQSAPPKVQAAYRAVYGDMLENAIVQHSPRISTPLPEEDTDKSKSNSNTIDPPDRVSTPSRQGVPAAATARPNIFTLYEQNIGMLTPMISDELRAAEKEYPEAWFGDAFKEAVSYNKRNWKYVRAILDRWKVDGPSSKRQVTIEPTVMHIQPDIGAYFDAK